MPTNGFVDQAEAIRLRNQQGFPVCPKCGSILCGVFCQEEIDSMCEDYLEPKEEE